MNDKVKGNTLVLGFYDRKNIGDDTYTVVFKKLFRNPTFVCMDDIDVLPSNIDIVVCGGGDIINDYFMKKAERLLQGFTGRVYAVSVGIPYESCSKYLHMFDHVFVRSPNDYKVASLEVGSRNVSMCGDAAFMLEPSIVPTSLPPPGPKKTGLFFSQPAFYQNPNRSDMINELVRLIDAFPSHQWHLLAFNYNNENELECDRIINRALRQKRPAVMIHSLQRPQLVLDFIATNVDICICMRYHSLVFSALCQKPAIALAHSTKMRNLASFIGAPCIDLPLDAQDRPTSLCSAKLINILSTPVQPLELPSYDKNTVIGIISSNKLRHVLIKPCTVGGWEDTLDRCTRKIARYLDISPENFPWEGPLTDDPKKAMNLARFICYLIAGNTDHPCVWGLMENIMRDDFKTREAIYYIWNDTKAMLAEFNTEHYYPQLQSINRRCRIRLDYLSNKLSPHQHRAGWAYTVGGLQNLSIPVSLSFDKSLFVDTYVDKTFHWGFDTLKNIGVIPYRKPWIGFIHHTFDETHSTYNNVELCKNSCFIESLKACKGLIVLSKYLRDKFVPIIDRLYLDMTLEERVPIYVLYHPTEFVSRLFTMNTFLNNNDRSVVQIGAWLRDPYAIYQLEVPEFIKKKALKGKEMDLYFPPADYSERLAGLVAQCEGSHPPTSSGHTHLHCSRGPAAAVNKFCQGAYNLLEQHLQSVEVVSTLSNDEYDDMLASNIVFLNLIDCSAVNTVIECIVRNTPIIVNRHPALIEILGPMYPGFYDSLREAEELIKNMFKIREIHIYITNLDKTRYKLEHFVEEFQKIVVREFRIETYPLIAPVEIETFFKLKYPALRRYLPSKF